LSSPDRVLLSTLHDDASSSSTIVVYGFGIAAFLLTVIAVVTGLRR
jgi:hypothetical protein